MMREYRGAQQWKGTRTRVSILTPIAESSIRYFAACARSITEQVVEDGPDIEWCVALDGLSDPSSAVIQSVLDGVAGVTIRLIRLPVNVGISAARNRAAGMATGDYVLFLDGDDLLPPRTVSTLVANARDGAALVFADSYDATEDLRSRLLRPKAALFEEHRSRKGTVSDPLLAVDFVYQPQLISFRAFESLGGFNEQLRYGEDVDLIQRVASLSRTVNFAYVASPLYVYRQNPGGVCHTAWESVQAAYEAVFTAARLAAGYPAQMRYNGVLLHGGVEFDVYLPRCVPEREHWGAYTEIAAVADHGRPLSEKP